jgi:hypothetical protein
MMAKGGVYRVRFGNGPNYTEEDIRKAILAVEAPEATNGLIEHIGLFPARDGDIVALVKFVKTPKFLQSLLSNPAGFYTLWLEGGGRADFDRSFTGFTPVNSPEDAEAIEAEYVGRTTLLQC